jgi:hypothetical protein
MVSAWRLYQTSYGRRTVFCGAQPESRRRNAISNGPDGNRIAVIEAEFVVENSFGAQRVRDRSANRALQISIVSRNALMTYLKT